MTEYLEAGEAERIRRIDAFFHRHPELAGVLDPAALVMNGLNTGDFDLMDDGAIVTASRKGEMIVEALRDIRSILGEAGQ